MDQEQSQQAKAVALGLNMSRPPIHRVAYSWRNSAVWNSISLLEALRETLPSASADTGEDDFIGTCEIYDIRLGCRIVGSHRGPHPIQYSIASPSRETCHLHGLTNLH